MNAWRAAGRSKKPIRSSFHQELEEINCWRVQTLHFYQPQSFRAPCQQLFARAAKLETLLVAGCEAEIQPYPAPLTVNPSQQSSSTAGMITWLVGALTRYVYGGMEGPVPTPRTDDLGDEQNNKRRWDVICLPFAFTTIHIWLQEIIIEFSKTCHDMQSTRIMWFCWQFKPANHSMLLRIN